MTTKSFVAISFLLAELVEERETQTHLSLAADQPGYHRAWLQNLHYKLVVNESAGSQTATHTQIQEFLLDELQQEQFNDAELSMYIAAELHDNPRGRQRYERRQRAALRQPDSVLDAVRIDRAVLPRRRAEDDDTDAVALVEEPSSAAADDDDDGQAPSTAEDQAPSTDEQDDVTSSVRLQPAQNATTATDRLHCIMSKIPPTLVNELLMAVMLETARIALDMFNPFVTAASPDVSMCL